MKDSAQLKLSETERLQTALSISPAKRTLGANKLALPAHKLPNLCSTRLGNFKFRDKSVLQCPLMSALAQSFPTCGKWLQNYFPKFDLKRFAPIPTCVADSTWLDRAPNLSHSAEVQSRGLQLSQLYPRSSDRPENCIPLCLYISLFYTRNFCPSSHCVILIATRVRQFKNTGKHCHYLAM